jgi:hypothetical protein
LPSAGQTESNDDIITFIFDWNKNWCFKAERRVLKNDQNMKNEVNDAGNIYMSLLAKNKIFGESSFVKSWTGIL